MRADQKRRTLRLLAAIAALTLLAGCRIPGATLGTEPLQLRFAAMTRTAIEAQNDAAPSDRYEPPARVTSAEPVVLAANEAAAVE
jgi:DMSO/TMAO reductase YedYZ molybdopterin-dependent catalytic subunit